MFHSMATPSMTLPLIDPTQESAKSVAKAFYKLSLPELIDEITVHESLISSEGRR